MAAPDEALSGDTLLNAVTDAMVGLHERYYHRAPAVARTVLMADEMLVSVLGGVYTDIEKTMIEVRRHRIVQENRRAFQQARRAKYIDAVERLSGRRVEAFISDTHVGPDLEVEIFMLAAA